MAKTAVFSICSNNYLARARTLFASLRQAHPYWEPFLLLVDEPRDLFEPEAEPFSVVRVRELPLPQIQRFLFRYTLLELNTAVKPWMLERLFQQGFDRVVYLDPDTFVYQPMSELEEEFEGGASVVLTPHLTGPYEDDRKPGYLEILRAGVWNLGFVALQRGEAAQSFLTWWQQRCQFDCVVDPPSGRFVDQRWVDLAPGLFQGVSLLRHEGYNVAYWNLNHRKVSREGEHFLVNDVPLRFFHFSGLDPEDPDTLSKHQDRYGLDDLGVVRDLVLDYCRRVKDNGLAECKPWPYAFAAFASGEPITDRDRWLYRNRPALQELAGPDPFMASASSFQEAPAAPEVPAAFLESGLRRVRSAARKHLGSLLQAALPAPILRSAQTPTTGPTELGLGVNLVGYILSEVGVGQSARNCATALKAAGVPFALKDYRVNCPSRAEDSTWARSLVESAPFPINVINVNADQFSIVHEHLGADFFQDRYTVGYWYWELPEFPDVWLDRFDLVQEVWVASRFVQEAVAAKSPVPVVRIPQAIQVSSSPDATRAAFGLPEGQFLFLMMYDMHSFQVRKNPQAVVNAFRKAFSGVNDVGLVIKVMNVETCQEEFDALRARLQDLPNVTLITETISRQAVYDLQSVCDAFVSLHRSEGFGLGLAECMALGRPVIGTNWSANVDFMNRENSCPVDYSLVKLEQDYGPYERGQVWADPDVDHAAWYMNKLVADASFRERIGAAGRATMHSEFSPEAVGALCRRRLQAILRFS